MEGAGPDRFLIGEEILGEERGAETGCRTGWMFLSWTRSGRLRRMAVFAFLPRTCLPRTFLPHTLARTWFGSFCIGCPAGDRRTNQQSNGYGLANLPPDFVEKKHALE